MCCARGASAAVHEFVLWNVKYSFMLRKQRQYLGLGNLRFKRWATVTWSFFKLQLFVIEYFIVVFKEEMKLLWWRNPNNTVRTQRRTDTIEEIRGQSRQTAPPVFFTLRRCHGTVAACTGVCAWAWLWLMRVGEKWRKCRAKCCSSHRCGPCQMGTVQFLDACNAGHAGYSENELWDGI